MKPHLRTIDRDKLIPLWDKGVPVAEIARRLGCTANGIYSAAYREGLPYRRRGNRPPRVALGERAGTDWTEVAQQQLYPDRSYRQLTRWQRIAIEARAEALAGLCDAGGL